jgi:hypothetical protein
MKKENWTLVHTATGIPVTKGEAVVDFRGDADTVTGGQPPHKPSSTGLVDVKRGSFYPSVFGLKWVYEGEAQ